MSKSTGHKKIHKAQLLFHSKQLNRGPLKLIILFSLSHFPIGNNTRLRCPNPGQLNVENGLDYVTHSLSFVKNQCAARGIMILLTASWRYSRLRHGPVVPSAAGAVVHGDDKGCAVVESTDWIRSSDWQKVA